MFQVFNRWCQNSISITRDRFDVSTLTLTFLDLKFSFQNGGPLVKCRGRRSGLEVNVMDSRSTFWTQPRCSGLEGDVLGSRSMFWTRGRPSGLEVDVMDTRSMFWTRDGASKLKPGVVYLRPTIFRFAAGLQFFFYSRPDCWDVEA